MAEKEYIERGALISKLEKFSKECELYGEWEDCRWSYEDSMFNIVENEPMANVEEVVRCKDCANSKNRTDTTCICKIFRKLMSAEDYCSYGAKMDKE